MIPFISPLRRHRPRLLLIVQTVGQVAALCLFWWAADARRLGLPVPGSIAGLFVLLLLLRLGWLPLGWVKAGADWLLAELLLFFIPAVVAVVSYAGVIRSVAWQIALVIVASTAVVMLGTALVVDWSYRIERRIRLARARHARTYEPAWARLWP